MDQLEYFVYINIDARKAFACGGRYQVFRHSFNERGVEIDESLQSGEKERENFCENQCYARIAQKKENISFDKDRMNRIHYEERSVINLTKNRNPLGDNGVDGQTCIGYMSTFCICRLYEIFNKCKRLSNDIGSKMPKFSDLRRFSWKFFIEMLKRDKILVVAKFRILFLHDSVI